MTEGFQLFNMGHKIHVGMTIILTLSFLVTSGLIVSIQHFGLTECHSEKVYFVI